MIKAVIIDDEQHSRNLINNMLSNFIDGVELIGEAKDVPSGIQLIKEKTPDLVFLDIEMPGGDGFSILNAFEELNFKVIFITGYDQYAIKAIKYAALDYLLKPIGLNELELAIKKYKQLGVDQKSSINFLHSKYQDRSKLLDEIILPGHADYAVISINQILRIESRRNHVVFYLENSIARVSTQPLSLYEDILPPNLFFRIHKSYIVNCAKVRNVETGRGGKVFLVDGTSLSIATRRKKAFITIFNQYHDSRRRS